MNTGITETEPNSKTMKLKRMYYNYKQEILVLIGLVVFVWVMCCLFGVFDEFMK
jgi:hypothetical protein